jgi:hypothetical protein
MPTALQELVLRQLIPSLYVLNSSPSMAGPPQPNFLVNQGIAELNCKFGLAWARATTDALDQGRIAPVSRTSKLTARGFDR